MLKVARISGVSAALIVAVAAAASTPGSSTLLATNPSPLQQDPTELLIPPSDFPQGFYLDEKRHLLPAGEEANVIGVEMAPFGRLAGGATGATRRRGDSHPGLQGIFLNLVVLRSVAGAHRAFGALIRSYQYSQQTPFVTSVGSESRGYQLNTSLLGTTTKIRTVFWRHGNLISIVAGTFSRNWNGNGTLTAVASRQEHRLTALS